MQNRALLRLVTTLLLFVVVFGALLFVAVQLFQIDYPMAGIIAVLLLIPFGLVYFGLQETSIHRAEQRVQQLALSRGLEVEKKTRHITSYDAHPEIYAEGSVFGYSLRHRFPRSSTWCLLVPQSGKGDFPNGWKLIIKEGQVSRGIKRQIATIASELAQEKGTAKTFVEIECYSDRIWAYLNENAGLKFAEKIFDLLRWISEKTE